MSTVQKSEAIEAEKEKIKKKQRILKEKEKKMREKSFLEIGRLSYEADIYSIDQKALLGAFLEINEKSKNEETKRDWRLVAEKWLDLKTQEARTPLSISIKENTDARLKSELKKMKFKWNNFRGEYYGYGSKEEIENLLKKFQSNFTIEIIK